MGRYLVRRFSLGLLSLWILVTFCFFLLRFLPGGPFLDEEQLHPLVRAHFEQSLGLHDSLGHQYLRYVENLAVMDFGVSYESPGTEVGQILLPRFFVTMKMAGLAFLVSLIGIFSFAFFSLKSAANEKVGGWIAMLGFALPGIVMAPLLVDLFSLRLGWLPVARLESNWGYLLPIFAMSVRPSLRFGQILAAELQRLSDSDVARYFQSLGFSKNRVTYYWIFPEALVAVIAQIGSLLAHLVAGSLFIEVIFAIPGVGSLFADALNARDYPVVLGITLWTGAFAFFCQFVADLLLAWADPRISFSKEME